MPMPRPNAGLVPPMPCPCCAIPMAYGRCPICRLCDGVHGPGLYVRVMKFLQLGRITLGHALAVLAMDDAWLCQVCTIDASGTFKIDRPVKRWEVAITQFKLHGVDTATDQGALQTVCGAALAPLIGKRFATHEDVEMAKREVAEAVLAAGAAIEIDVKARVEPDGNLVLECTAKALSPTAAPDTVQVFAPDVEIPADVMLRARGSA